MLFIIKKGTTSKRLPIHAIHSDVTTEAGLTGLVFNSGSLVWYYWRENEGNVGATAVSIVTATLGTWTSGGFKEKDATNFPGDYEIGVPDAALATGANWVTMILFGAANMRPIIIEIQLVDYDPNDGVRLGLSALPAAPLQLKKNQALPYFKFPMYNGAGNPTTGLTVTGTRAIDNGAFAACANAVTELSNGWYKISLAASDLNGDVIAFRFAATGALDTNREVITQA